MFHHCVFVISAGIFTYLKKMKTKCHYMRIYLIFLYIHTHTHTHIHIERERGRERERERERERDMYINLVSEKRKLSK